MYTMVEKDSEKRRTDDKNYASDFEWTQGRIRLIQHQVDDM